MGEGVYDAVDFHVSLFTSWKPNTERLLLNSKEDK